MSENDETQGQTPAEVTLQDLWRHISGMESRLRGEIQGVRTEMNERFDGQDKELAAVTTKLDIHTGELEAIRSVVDDLASHKDVVNAERRIGTLAGEVNGMSTEIKKLDGNVRKLISRVDRAGIPAE